MTAGHSRQSSRSRSRPSSSSSSSTTSSALTARADTPSCQFGIRLLDGVWPLVRLLQLLLLLKVPLLSLLPLPFLLLMQLLLLPVAQEPLVCYLLLLETVEQREDDRPDLGQVRIERLLRRFFA